MRHRQEHISFRSSMRRRHMREDAKAPRTPIYFPVIRALLSAKTRAGHEHRDVPRDKAIRGNLSDGQVSEEREEERIYERA